MVQQMLDGLGGDHRISGSTVGENDTGAILCYHVNARFSNDMEDIGSARLGKLWHLLRYALQANVARFRYGIPTFYHIPAPPKRSALYRDWLIIALCRPFFKNWVMHWHAGGLREWLNTHAKPWERWLTEKLYATTTLSLTLSNWSTAEAASFHPAATCIVPNGIPDPCPDFNSRLLPLRRARSEERRQSLQAFPHTGEPLLFRVLFLAHCTRDKGVFDALEAVALANAGTSDLRVELTIAGNFLTQAEEQEFHQRIKQPDLQGAVRYIGFADSAKKRELFESHDCFCFPTSYAAESFPLVLLEAMAFGATIITTAWRAIPEALPPNTRSFVPLHSPQEIARRFRELAPEDDSERHRAHFLANFTSKQHLRRLSAALLSLEEEPTTPSRKTAVQTRE